MIIYRLLLISVRMMTRDLQPNQEFKDDFEEEIMEMTDVQELRREIERLNQRIEYLVEHLQERERQQEIWEEEMRESRPDDQA